MASQTAIMLMQVLVFIIDHRGVVSARDVVMRRSDIPLGESGLAGELLVGWHACAAKSLARAGRKPPSDSVCCITPPRACSCQGNPLVLHRLAFDELHSCIW